MVTVCLQVFDMLMVANVPYSSRPLSQLFSVAKVSHECFSLLELEMDLRETSGISYLILAEVFRRAPSVRQPG